MKALHPPRTSSLHAMWLVLCVLAVVAPPRRPLPEPTDVQSSLRRIDTQRPTMALPTVNTERLAAPLGVAKLFHGVTTPSLQHAANSKEAREPRPVERGVWRGVKHARLRACPPQGPPVVS